MEDTVYSILGRLESLKYHTDAPLLVQKTIDLILELNTKVSDREATIRSMDSCLCNYINEVGDDFEPIEQWNDNQKNAFEALTDSYNNWHEKNDSIGELSRIYFTESREYIGARVVGILEKVCYFLDEKEPEKARYYIQKMINDYKSDMF